MNTQKKTRSLERITYINIGGGRKDGALATINMKPRDGSFSIPVGITTRNLTEVLDFFFPEKWFLISSRWLAEREPVLDIYPPKKWNTDDDEVFISLMKTIAMSNKIPLIENSERSTFDLDESLSST